MEFSLCRKALGSGRLLHVSVFVFLVVIWFVPTWWAVTIILLTLTLLGLARVGTELRPDRRAYREYLEFLGRRMGSWQPLLPVVSITLRYFYFSELTRGTSGRSSAGIWKSGPQQIEELVLMLSLENSPTGLILIRGSLDAVNPLIDAAHELAAFFDDVPVHQFLPPNRFQPL